jgi:threonylcarbamoyladenosine tRNA methylthiotransferase MtaB
MNTGNDMAAFSTYTLGCKVNQYDTNAMVELLENAGYKHVEWGGRADICIINTCTVTNTADAKSRNIINRAVKNNPGAIVVVCGCLAQKDADALMETNGVAAVVGTENRGSIVSVVENALGGKRKNIVSDIGKNYEPALVTTGNERTRGYIKIQEGCNNFCSYCIIPYVRGRVRSRSVEDAVFEAEKMAGNGIKEVVLTGIHISSYGTDCGTGLTELIEKIDEWAE